MLEKRLNTKGNQITEWSFHTFIFADILGPLGAVAVNKIRFLYLVYKYVRTSCSSKANFILGHQRKINRLIRRTI